MNNRTSFTGEPGVASRIGGRGRGLAASLLGVLLWTAAAPPVGATDIDPDAERILKAMSAHLAGLSTFSLKADVDIEVMLEKGQKIQLSASAEVLAKRPGHLRVRRTGSLADMEIVFDGSTLTVHGHNLNAYAQFPVKGSIDDAIRAYELETGLPAPGADLLFADSYAALSPGVESSRYLGTTRVGGVECHHLAFRENDVDWQIWVRTGDAPLPMKYVITSAWDAGAPQYQMRITEWNVKATPGDNDFAFVPPKGAVRLEVLRIDEFGSLISPQ